MPRPRKFRRVCYLPARASFGPLETKDGSKEIIVMSVEEYETIRLIDLEGLMQEECAKRMNVARTTVQRIYMDARKKLALSLVNGNILKISGGDYKLCEDSRPPYGCGKCRRQGFGQNRNGVMDNENSDTSR